MKQALLLDAEPSLPRGELGQGWARAGPGAGAQDAGACVDTCRLGSEFCSCWQYDRCESGRWGQGDRAVVEAGAREDRRGGRM